MENIIYFENEERSCLYNTLVLQQIRQLYGNDLLTMISAGDFTSGGRLLKPSCKERAEEYVKNGADLVLSLPAASVLGGYGKKEFAGAALMQRLRTANKLILSCEPLPGQSVKDCERSLRDLAMLMFQEKNGYRRKLSEYLAENLPFRKAQHLAVCSSFPEASDLLASSINRQALWMLDSLLQLYYMAKTEFIIAPECGDCEETAGDTDRFEKNAAAKTAELLASSSYEQIIDIAGSTSQLVTDLFDKKDLIMAAGTFEEIVQLLGPSTSARTRLFLLKSILGLRKIYMQICSLHVFVPYCHVSAKNDNKKDQLKQLEDGSWVPFTGDPDREQSINKDYNYLLQIDKKAEELANGRL